MEVPRREAKRIIPDVAIVESGHKAGRAANRLKGTAGIATLKPVTIPLPRVTREVRDVWIEILRYPGRKPVSIIELLSPTNKTGDGALEYRLKRRKTIRRKIHLIEFDFLLAGQRLPMDAALPRGDYYAFVARADRRPDCDVYAWTIRDRMPTIPVPLLRKDPEVMLDLVEVFATTYERGRYARQIDYSAPLTLVRKPEDRAWAEGIARRVRR